MNIPLEVAKTLHSNELARLHCHRLCPAAKTCTGLEAHLLRKLQLLETPGNELVLTHFGADVAKLNSTSFGETSIPKLIG